MKAEIIGFNDGLSVTTTYFGRLAPVTVRCVMILYDASCGLDCLFTVVVVSLIMGYLCLRSI